MNLQKVFNLSRSIAVVPGLNRSLGSSRAWAAI
jgi:hypothetical protein